MKSENLLLKHSLLIIKFLFSRTRYVCPKLIFKFCPGQAQTNSVVQRLTSNYIVIFFTFSSWRRLTCLSSYFAIGTDSAPTSRPHSSEKLSLTQHMFKALLK